MISVVPVLLSLDLLDKLFPILCSLFLLFNNLLQSCNLNLEVFCFG